MCKLISFVFGPPDVRLQLKHVENYAFCFLVSAIKAVFQFRYLFIEWYGMEASYYLFIAMNNVWSVVPIPVNNWVLLNSHLPFHLVECKSYCISSDITKCSSIWTCASKNLHFWLTNWRGRNIVIGGIPRSFVIDMCYLENQLPKYEEKSSFIL